MTVVRDCAMGLVVQNQRSSGLPKKGEGRLRLADVSEGYQEGYRPSIGENLCLLQGAS